MASVSPVATPSHTPGAGQVVPAPGSNSSVYRPNPGAIVVAIDPGHGGCLDWGVPNPYDNKAAKSEKADTLGIALALKTQLEAQGVTVVLDRTTDAALAGDDYPPLGCNDSAPWRDVNGDGLKGFGPGVDEGTRTRDELSARIDFANVAQADVEIAIHINSFVGASGIIKIAATQTFFTNAFPWAEASQKLAKDVQSGVVASLGAATSYKRQDRGTDGTAPYLYELKPAGMDPKSPRRPLLMPAILTEVGSVSLEAESMFLATDAGYKAAARGIFDGIASYLADRPLAARLELVPSDGSTTIAAPTAVDGDGPPFWPMVVQGSSPSIRLVNTGTAQWPAGMRLAGGWGATAMPYLAAAPKSLVTLAASVPALGPGESVALPVTLPDRPSSGRQVCWLTLVEADGTALSQLGSPPLQLASEGP